MPTQFSPHDFGSGLVTEGYCWRTAAGKKQENSTAVHTAAAREGAFKTGIVVGGLNRRSQASVFQPHFHAPQRSRMDTGTQVLSVDFSFFVRREMGAACVAFSRSVWCHSGGIRGSHAVMPRNVIAAKTPECRAGLALMSLRSPFGKAGLILLHGHCGHLF